MTTTPVNEKAINEKLSGCLLGMAVGDALGLPSEGLTRQRAAKVFGTIPLTHRFVFKHGMVSDDTEHAVMVAESLLFTQADAHRFASALAWKLRLWLLALPAGVGLATARAIFKLWVGRSPIHSGVASAGNGPAMRAPILGATFAFCQGSFDDFVAASTRITHTDPRAEQGARLIASAAREGALHGPVRDTASLLASWRSMITDPQLLSAMERVEQHLSRQSSVVDFADDLGLQQGVSGFINHTVPVVLYAWLRYPNDFRRAVEEVIVLGGDADTTGAIIGGLMGATLGESAIPDEWLEGIIEWPRSITWMRALCAHLAESITTRHAIRPPRCFKPGVIFRNIVFLLIVLYHGFRRRFPPY